MSRGPESFTVLPSSLANSVTGFTGLLLSLVRQRPTASKFSRLKPSGLIMRWQCMQASLLVSSVIFSRMVSLGLKCASSNTTAFCGGLSDMPTMLRVRKTPR